MNEDRPSGAGDRKIDAGELNEILLGLNGEKKVLASKLLYDATGSELFDGITDLPEYYLTRTEKRLLGEYATDIVAALPVEVGRTRALVEFGASDESKAVSLLNVPGGHFSNYLAIDISPSVLGPIRSRMQVTHPRIKVEILLADFMLPFSVRGTVGHSQAVGFLPGSTIGQYPPATVTHFLQNVRVAFAGAGCSAFVIGTDQCRDPRRVLPAYNDAAGISRAFQLNILSHVNRLTDGNLDQRNFGHKALWNASEERVEMYLVSLLSQSARLGGQMIHFSQGETIQTGMSYKYGRERFASFAAEAGWTSAGFWHDSQNLFGIHLLQAS
jgi:dimethylhistidine N-methyltransferase